MLLAVNQPLHQHLRQSRRRDETMCRTLHGIVADAKNEAARIPGTLRVPGYIAQRTPLAAFGANAVKRAAGQIVSGTGGEAATAERLTKAAFNRSPALGIENRKRLVLRIQSRARGVTLWYSGIDSVIGHGQAFAPERIEMSYRRSRGVGCSFLRGILICGALLCRVAESASNTQIVPGSKYSCGRPQQAQKEIANIAIDPRIVDENGIVGIPGLLPPCVEDRFFKTVVGMQNRDHAVRRIVEQHRTETG